MRRLAVFIVILLYCFIAATPVKASDAWKSLPQNTCSAYPLISACNLNYIIETNIQTLGHLVIGSPGDPQSVSQSAAGTLSYGLGIILQTPPVSSRDYLAYMNSRFHIPGTPQPAYAADGGVGYTSLTPILKIWVVMRNLAYLVFAIVFVVIGIMILIRSKIDPKTTVNVQNALPKIIFALVLVTFSYAIAGFLIDIMYVALGLVLTIAGSIDARAGALGNKIIANNIFFAFFDGFTMDKLAMATAGINTMVNNFLNIDSNTFVLGGITGFITQGIGFLIIAIAIIWALFKTWIALLSAYAHVVLGILFSPLQLMIDAVPGQNQLDGWIRNMLSNLLAFPVVLTMILIGLLLGNVSSVDTADFNPGFVPPLIGSSNQDAMQALIGIAIILTIPKTVEILQEVLKVPKTKWGTAWGEAIGAGATATTAGVTGSYGYSRDRIFGQEALRWQKEMKPFKEGTAPPAAVKPSRWSKGGIGDLLRAKPT